MAKRLIDLLGAVVGLTVLAPVFAAVAVAIKLDTRGPVFFRQVRIGRHLVPFRVYKFRTMRDDDVSADVRLSTPGDRRITRVGRVLRRTKIDELPQLINVLRGEMSLVGPRPEVPKYVAMYRSDFEHILHVRPGITDLASMKYRDEEERLARSPDIEHEYVTAILPDKIRLAKCYLRRSSLAFDLVLICKTFGGLFRRAESG